MFYAAQKVASWWTAWRRADAQTNPASNLAGSQQSDLSLQPLQLSRQALEGAAFALSGSPSSDAMAWLRLARPELFVSPVLAAAATSAALEPEPPNLELALKAEARGLLSSSVKATDNATDDNAIDSDINGLENTATWAVS